jgi:hypothetical protein
MVFPEYRPRRMRRNEALRSLIRETTLSAGQLIYPLFIVPGKKVKKEVSSMPGVHQISVDQLAAGARGQLGHPFRHSGKKGRSRIRSPPQGRYCPARHQGSEE